MAVTLISVFVVFSLATIAFLVSYYEYHGFGSEDGIMRRGEKTLYKTAALTFDDGPSPEYTPKILDILNDYQIKATFFLTGEQAETQPDLVRRIAKEGHEVGNHTYSHANLIFLKEAALVEEIDRGEMIIRDLTGERPLLFRPPRGLFNEKVRKAVLARGYTMILWSVSAADWGPLGASLIMRRIKQFVHPGAILLFHDGGALVKNGGARRIKTVKVLPNVIDYLLTEGYELITAGEMKERI